MLSQPGRGPIPPGSAP